jgi:predicted DsbA family dithiol-disulfide isomerase
MNENKELITVEIWSDVMCPFCYLGKKRFEKALADFDERDKVSVTWKSFQLNPSIVTDTEISIFQYLSDSKGIPLEKAKEMNAGIALSGRQLGIEYNFDRAVVANTFRAHVLLHLAKKYSKQDAVEELLFRAYFTDGKNVDDPEVLKTIAAEAGIDPDEALKAVTGEDYEDEVRHDFYEARQLGIKSVPFFVFNRRYGISGAQPVELFLQTLDKIENKTI